MSILPVYPVILQDGTVADANQVMADFYAVQNAVNTNAAQNGANSDITSLSGLTTPIPISEGGTGAITAPQALINLGVTAAIAAIVTVPIGATLVWNAATGVPTGFLEENGQALSRVGYAALFAIIGTTFGAGDGSTTFNIPDSRGYFNRGWADTGSIDSGRVFGSIQADQFQTHTHIVTDPGHLHSIPVGLETAGSAYISPSSGPGSLTNNTGTSTTGLTVTGPNSGSYGTETRPKNIARMNIIRVQ